MTDRPVVKSEKEWREELTPEQYEVLRKAGTEAAFTGELVYNKASGSYRCAACDAELFSSDTKFDSGTGWPSFTEPAVADVVEVRPDNSLFMRRTEVLCRACGGHLGHVFDDGPGPTGERYCINSAALSFQPEGSTEAGGPASATGGLAHGVDGPASAAGGPAPAPAPAPAAGAGEIGEDEPEMDVEPDDKGP